MKKCFLLLAITSLVIAAGCSSDTPAPSNTDGGVQDMQIDVDSGT